MAHIDDTEYLLRREREARAMAQKAAGPKVRSIHEELAKRYARLAGKTAY